MTDARLEEMLPNMDRPELDAWLAWKAPDGLFDCSPLSIAHIAFISGIRAAQATGDWRPIETAPKDGTMIIGAVHGATFPMAWNMQSSSWWSMTMVCNNPETASDQWVNELFTVHIADEPPEWRPLPARPTPQAKEG